ncbi:MAG: cell division protein FtsQ/DivIB [Bacilli bacterium]
MSKMGFPEKKNIIISDKKNTVASKNKKKIKPKRQKNVYIKNVKKVKTRKIHFRFLFLVLIVLFLISFLIFKILQFPVKNIIVSGNKLLSDQNIIEIANIEYYPSIFSFTSNKLEKKLEKNKFIINATVKKKFFSQVFIEIEENTPLFYNSITSKTVLKDKTEIEEILKTPILVNYIPDTLYDKFINRMLEVELDILRRISEIKYDPNSVDDERFLLTMNDGNYAFLTLETWTSINNYIDIIKNFDTKKGILYLDSGDYFKILTE